jgi:prepilin peptidase CpaA
MSIGSYMTNPSFVTCSLIVVVALIAMITDLRKGVIPNWLTLPLLAFAPLYFGIAAGVGGLGSSILGLCVCGLIPFLLFTRRAIGGGDVKLFAAIGAMAGVRSGIETELLSMIVVAIYSLGRLAWDGTLTRTLTNSIWLLLNCVLPRARRRQIRPELMASVRMGGAIFIASLWALFETVPTSWVLP